MAEARIPIVRKTRVSRFHVTERKLHTVAVTYTIRADVKEWLEKLATFNHRSISNLVNSILIDRMELGTVLEIDGGLTKTTIPFKGTEEKRNEIKNKIQKRKKQRRAAVIKRYGKSE